MTGTYRFLQEGQGIKARNHKGISKLILDQVMEVEPNSYVASFRAKNRNGVDAFDLGLRETIENPETGIEFDFVSYSEGIATVRFEFTEDLELWPLDETSF